MTTTHYSGSTYLQNVNYKYNIRGWLTDINNVDNLSISPDPVDLFAYRINYNEDIQYDVNGMVRPLYNGNIAETTWRTASDNTRRRYAYSYDYLNRLRDAWYQVPGSTTPVAQCYNEHLTYDSNGNILSLFRYGEVDDPNNLIEIDDLEYEYDLGNKLINVVDYTTHSAGFNDGNQKGVNGNTDNDFEYDTYGNLIKDRNKEIDEIVYNHLNLPKKIIFENENTIEYLYDASGTKLRKIVTDNTTSPATVTTTHYLDGFQYIDDKLEFFPTAEGYVKVTHKTGGTAGGGTTASYNYVFNYTDHLGNIRLRYALNEDNWMVILEEDHYYPFGLKHKGYNAENYVFISFGGGPVQLIPTNPDALETYKYKYGGSELQEEFNLNVYAYGWRDYDPAIGRFNKLDRFSEKYYSKTPYGYAGNNPVLINDIQGDSLWISFGNRNQHKALYEDGQLLNADGSRYEGAGVKVKNDGSVKIKNSFLKSAVRELGKVAEAESANGTNVISTLQGSENNFTIAQGSNRFDPGTFDQPYLFANNATYNMTTSTGLTLLPFWDAEKMGYSLQDATQAGSGGIIYFDGTSSQGVKLGHEMFHAFDANTGNLIHQPIVDPRTHIGGTVIGEIRASTFGNQIRSHHNVKPLRQKYHQNHSYNLLNPDGSIKQMPPSIIINQN